MKKVLTCLGGVCVVVGLYALVMHLLGWQYGDDEDYDDYDDYDDECC